MRKEASLEQWKELYEVAAKLKKLKPWEELWDMDLITICSLKDKEPCMCSVMGKGGECFAIGCYIGFKAIYDFFQIVDNQDIPQEQLIRYQSNIMCFFGSREELSNKELKLIKDLGLKFRGKNNWIYFRVFDPKYAQYMPEEEQVVKVTEILKHLYMAIKALHSDVKVNFAKGNMLVRRFDRDTEMWINYEHPVVVPELKYEVAVLKDELLIKRLNNQKKVKTYLELDIAYLNSVIRDKKYDNPIMHRLCILADGKTGNIVDQTMVIPDIEESEIVVGMLANYILQRGKPKIIFVRDKYIESMLMDMCERLDINLERKSCLKNIDEFVTEFSMMRYW